MIFVDRIDRDKFDEGVRLSLTNAERLLFDAKLLFENGRYPSSKIFAMLSWEETAKAYFIIECKNEKKSINKNEWGKKFTQHVAKLDGVQNIMGLYGEPIFEDDMVEISLMSMGYLEDHSVQLKKARAPPDRRWLKVCLGISTVRSIATRLL